MTSIEVLTYLSQDLPIAEYRLIKFPNWTLLQDHITDSVFKTELLTYIQNRGSSDGMPFWDAALTYISNHSEGWEEIVSNADHHNKVTTDFWIPAYSIKNWIEEKGKNIGINSLVQVIETGLFHLPMLDFHISISHKNTKMIMQICRQLGLNKGFILNSGNSYHFIGKQLITEDKLIDTLSRALLYGPIVDTRWIAHQLIERSCTLRIGEKNGLVPYVVEELN